MMQQKHSIERQTSRLYKPFNKKSSCITIDKPSLLQESLFIKSRNSKIKLNMNQRNNTPQKISPIINESTTMITQSQKAITLPETTDPVNKNQHSNNKHLRQPIAYQKIASYQSRNLNPEDTTNRLSKQGQISTMKKGFFGQQKIVQQKLRIGQDDRFNGDRQRSQLDDTVEEMLRVIYGAIWNDERYRQTLEKYHRVQSSLQQTSQEFNTEGKLLQDIVQGIQQLKLNTKKVQQNKPLLQQVGDRDTFTTQKYFNKHYSLTSSNLTHSSINQSKQTQQSIVKQLEQQLNLRNKTIQNLHNKIEQLQLKLQGFQQQCAHLHRLNESKYSQISQLKRQLLQQQSFMQEQITVIEELQKTVILNNSTFINSTIIEPLDMTNILDTEEEVIKQNEQIQKMNLFYEGKEAGWRQFLCEIEGQIQFLLRHVQSQRLSKNELKQDLQQSQIAQYVQREDKDVGRVDIRNGILNQHIRGNKDYFVILQNIQSHYHQDYDINYEQDDGIEQLDISFKHDSEVATQTDLTYPSVHQTTFPHKDKQVKLLTVEDQQQQLVDEQISVIECSKHYNHYQELSGNNYVNPDYFQTSVEEFSFISANPGKYLENIQAMTRELSDAYETINKLKQQISSIKNNYTNQTIINNQNSDLNRAQPIIQKNRVKQVNEQRNKQDIQKIVDTQNGMNTFQTRSNGLAKKLGLNFSFWK